MMMSSFHRFITSCASISVIFLLRQQSSIFTLAAECVSPANVCSGWGDPFRPLPGCKEYVQCERGAIKFFNTCMDGTLFDVYVQACNWDYDTFCDIETCAPSMKPTLHPTTGPPTAFPSAAPSVSPSSSPTPEPSFGPTYNFFYSMEANTMKWAFQDTVLVAYNANGIKFPSTRYTYDGMITAVEEMASAGIQSDGRDFRFYVGNEESNLQYGRTNLAAFLAMAMTESILYDTCDELNEAQVAGKYAISNSCGQHGRSYQDEVCTNPAEAIMSCDVDVNMVVVSSSTSINQGGRPPPPLSCRPKADWSDYAGYWDSRTGQASTNPYANTLGRIDTEGCCFWGRGVLLTRGVCNIGRLNYYLGKRAHDERGEGRFPTIDFCKDPEATCASDSSTETMRWITGLFDWIYRVQSYEADSWSYMKALRKFVDNGFVDDDDERYPFIDTVSSVFVRDCHDIKCSNLQVTKKDARRFNFYKVMEIMKMTDKPTRKPTQNPTAFNEPTPAPSKPKIEIKPPPPVWSQPPPIPGVTLTGNLPSTTDNISPASTNPSPTSDINPVVVNLTPPAPSTNNEEPQQSDVPFEGLIVLNDNAACSCSITGVAWSLSIAIAIACIVLN